MKKSLIIPLSLVVFIVIIGAFVALSGKKAPLQKGLTEAQKGDCLKKYPYKLTDGISLCSSEDDFTAKYPAAKKEKNVEYSENELNSENTQLYEQTLEEIGHGKMFLYNSFPNTIPFSSVIYQATQNFDDNFEQSDSSDMTKDSKWWRAVTYTYDKKLNWPAKRLDSLSRYVGDNYNFRKHYNELVALNGEPSLKQGDMISTNEFVACWGNCVAANDSENTDSEGASYHTCNKGSSCMILNFIYFPSVEDGGEATIYAFTTINKE